MLAAQFQFERSQWWPAQQLAAHQLEQLRSLVAFAVQHVPHYRTLIGARSPALLRDPSALTWEEFAGFPILHRADLREHGAALLATRPLQDHGGTSWNFTRGTTGTAARVAVSTVAHFFRSAQQMRLQLWHDLDFSLTLAEIRPGVTSGRNPGWGAAPNVAYETGPCVTLPIGTTIEAQLDWLVAEAPGYLHSTASNLRALLLHSRQTGRKPRGLDALLSHAETLPADLRALAREIWDTRVIDSYACAEAGMMALQCPDHDHFHVQAETVIVEVLRDDGRACAPGEIGRVVVTDLVNFGMPLIRYELGDRAEAGAPCACGRGLAVITRIIGRDRAPGAGEPAG